LNDYFFFSAPQLKRDPLDGATMSHPRSYALQKLADAVEVLATGPGDVRSRLYSAWLSFHTVTERHLPVELHGDLNWILHQISRIPRRNKLDRGSVQATLATIRNSTGTKIAKRILSLERRLREYHDKAPSNKRLKLPARVD
jgi:hypothetical protein